MIKNLKINECKKLLSENYIGRIAYISQGSPDIIPITYYYSPEGNSIISYSGEGGKINAMRDNNSVAFQVDEVKSMNNWRSVLVIGEFEELSGIDAKHLLHEFSEGVKKNILRKEAASPQFISEFSNKLSSDGIPIVYRIKILETVGKKRDS